jgi:hypothetical protein
MIAGLSDVSLGGGGAHRDGEEEQHTHAHCLRHLSLHGHFSDVWNGDPTLVIQRTGFEKVALHSNTRPSHAALPHCTWMCKDTLALLNVVRPEPGDGASIAEIPVHEVHLLGIVRMAYLICSPQAQAVQQ